MRAVLILAGAVTFGLAAGYGWAAMSRARPAVTLPKPVTVKPVELPQSESDKEWAARAVDENATALAPQRADPAAVERSVHYAGCNEVRALGKAPLHAGEPGYRSEMDGDGDGIACEPHRPA